jgi:hypothetical protein
VKDVLEICGIYAGFDRDSAGRYLSGDACSHPRRISL